METKHESLVKQRLKRFLKQADETQENFGLKIGVSTGYVSTIRNGISNEVAQRIRDAYPELNIEWLLTGDGEMIKKGYGSQQVSNNAVPLLPLAAHGGSLNGYDADGVTRISCETILSPIEGAEMAIAVTGDSMEPDYPSGSKVLIKAIDHKAFIAWGEAYVIDTSNGVLLKRVVPGKDDSHISCLSVNPSYPPFEICLSDVRKIYKVLASIICR